MRPRAPGIRRIPALGAALALAFAVAGCGGAKLLHQTSTVSATVTTGVPSASPAASQGLGFPLLATKNTTRVDGTDPIADAAGVALAVYPSAAPGTHPPAVALAPTDDWQAALAASVLMAPPIRAPILLSGSGSLPTATSQALSQLAPTGAGAIRGAPPSAMPAAGGAAESGNPILFVNAGGIPGPTRQALATHQGGHIYVLGPP